MAPLYPQLADSADRSPAAAFSAARVEGLLGDIDGWFDLRGPIGPSEVAFSTANLNSQEGCGVLFQPTGEFPPEEGFRSAVASWARVELWNEASDRYRIEKYGLAATAEYDTFFQAPVATPALMRVFREDGATLRALGVYRSEERGAFAKDEVRGLQCLLRELKPDVERLESYTDFDSTIVNFRHQDSS